jgi:hypothetical protein
VEPLGLVLLEDHGVEPAPTLVDRVIALAEPHHVVPRGQRQGEAHPVCALAAHEPLDTVLDQPLIGTSEHAALGNPARRNEIKPVTRLRIAAVSDGREPVAVGRVGRQGRSVHRPATLASD